jgi:hypothetical protein
MRRTVLALALAGISSIACLLLSGPAHAGESVPINATFGIEWTQVNWTNPFNRITETRGAAGLANGSVIAIATGGHSNAFTGIASSDYVHLRFSETDWVHAQYVDVPIVFDPVTNTASLDGLLEVVGGEGTFAGASGTLTMRIKLLVSDLLVGTIDIKGVVRTAD